MLPYLFSFTEVLSILGVAQSVYLIVVMFGRSARPKDIIVPGLFFGWLTICFMTFINQDQWYRLLPSYDFWRWILWTFLPVFSLPILFQIFSPVKKPLSRFYIIILLWSLFLFSAGGVIYRLDPNYLELVSLFSTSFIVLFFFIFVRDLDKIKLEKSGPERFWLIIGFLLLHVILIIFDGLLLYDRINHTLLYSLRLIAGLGFVYIASTGLFRVYPYVVSIYYAGPAAKLNAQEREDLMQIDHLMNRQKIYQEIGCNRSQLARELEWPESRVSSLIKKAYSQTVPDFINDYRIKDVQFLLKDTSLSITEIAEEAGFNSIATLNRVYKKKTGRTPSEYRLNPKNKK
jgi:AraC-like DNA-binding protein